MRYNAETIGRCDSSINSLCVIEYCLIMLSRHSSEITLALTVHRIYDSQFAMGLPLCYCIKRQIYFKV